MFIRLRHDDVLLQQILEGQAWLDAGSDQRGRVALHQRGQCDRCTGLPTVQAEEAGNAADGVSRAAAQINVLVTVKIHGVAALAARHELRDADGTGVRAFVIERRLLILPGQQQELFKLVAEKRCAGRVIERQRGQRFQHPELPHVLPVFGFDTDDGDDDLARDTVDGFSTNEVGRVLMPEADAVGNASFINEALTVTLPGALQFGNSGWPDGAQDRRVGADR